MKSKVLISFLMASLVFLLFQVEGLAADKTWNSKATITFEENNDETPPLDPDDPTKDLDPADPDDTTHQNGPLSLDYVSSIDFDSQKITGHEQEIYQSKSLKPFIQITDNRGTGVGWKVTAAASSFKNGADDTLSGSIITFKNGKVVTPTMGVAEPKPESTVALTTDGVATNVVNAEVGTGLGTWLNRWFPTSGETGLNDSVTLEIPAGVATVGTHEATITWTLTDAPI